MRFRTALIVVGLFAATPALAQVAPREAPSAPAAPAKPEPAQPVEQPTVQEAAPQKVDPAKEAAIRHLMDITDSSKMGDHISAAIENQVHQVMSHKLPDDRLQAFMTSFSQKFHARVPSERVVDLIVPIYASHFSMEDIQALIQFYESPLGQRVVKVLPEIDEESQEGAARMEQDGALATLREMTDDYPELKALLPPQPPSLAPTPAPTPAPAPAPAAPKQ